MKVILVPHTHWDREWYEPFSIFQGRLLELFDGLLELMAREPRFRHFHLDGQSAMVDDYLALRPEREADLAALFRAGRLSIGPWFTQMDEFLTSGESTVRNLEWGLARARSFGVSAPVGGPWAGYLPDQFGHIGQMPQILRTFGIERAVLWRGVPSAIDRTAFRWRSPDGSEVLAEYFVADYGVAREVPEHLGSSDDLAGELGRVVGLVAPHSDRDVVLVPVGDDHMVPSPRLAELIADAGAASGLDMSIGSIAEFLAEAPAPADAPTWTGELRAASRGPLLPNVYSTRPHQKARRARLEARLERYAEPLDALVGEPAASSDGDAAAAAFREAWRRLLWNGAHDSVCGCSHDQVARDVDARFAEAEALVEGVIAARARSLAARAASAGIVRWNPSPFEREGIPGLGWTVVTDAASAAAATRPVDVRVDGGRIILDDGIALTLGDEDDVGDLYTFCPPDDGRPAGPASLEAAGPGRVVARFAGASVELGITRTPGEPFVRIDGAIDNDRPDHRLRLWVELDGAPAGSTALAPFEVVERPLVGEGYVLEAGSPTWPARGAVLAADVALFADGVMEYEVAGSWLGVALLRATGRISAPWLATRPVDAGPETPTPDAQCLGRTTFRLAIERGATREGLVASWERFALPVLEVAAPGGGTDAGGRLLEVDGVCLSAIRRLAGGEIEVRAWNDGREARQATIAGRRMVLGPARIEAVRLPAPAPEAAT